MRFLKTATLYGENNLAKPHHPLRVHVADNTWARFRGLMLRPPLKSEPHIEGLLITRCPSVHGFFMRFAVDVVYLARSEAQAPPQEATYTVTHTTHLKPWRVSVGRRRITRTPQGQRVDLSGHALELPAGSIERLRIQPGDELRLGR